MKKKLYIIVSFMLLLISSGCTSSGNDSKQELNIAAAANFSLAFAEIGKKFEEDTGIKVIFSFGSTGQLADQIENGAPFDLFASADKSFVEYLKEKQLLINDTAQLFAVGRIGIVTKKDKNVNSIEDLVKENVVKLAIANPDHAPYGLAAKQALQSARIWDEVESKLVYGRNISDTLTYVETGNAEAAIVAKSLVNKDHVRFILIDEENHQPIEQMIAVIKRTATEDKARQFIEFLKGPIGKPIMESYGFKVPN